MPPPPDGGASSWEVISSAYLRISGRVLQWLSIVVLALMTGINAFNIVSRVLFDTDLEATQELLMIGAMALYFLSISLITKDNAELRIDAVARVLPRAWQDGLGLAARLVVLGFQAMVLWLAVSTLQFVRMFHTPIIGFSEAVFFVPVIAGAGDMAVTELIFLTRQLSRQMGVPGSGLPDLGRSGAETA